MPSWSHKAGKKAKRRYLIETRNCTIGSIMRSCRALTAVVRKDAKKLDFGFHISARNGNFKGSNIRKF